MLKQIRQSLITRLMMYFLLVGFLFIVLFGINFAHGIRVHFKQEILPNIAQYLGYIVDDIGTPPDLQRARELTRSLSFQLRITGPDVSWSSQDSKPPLTMLDFERAPKPYEKFRVARHKRQNYVLLKVGDYEYLYVIGPDFKGQRQQRSLFFFATILGSLLILFWLIRRSLKPITGINEGVQRIGQGDLKQSIQPEGSSEFKNLAQGINNMAEQIDSMLQSKQQLLLAISHELRSPLTRARVNLELLPEHENRQALVDDLNEMQDLISLILESERLHQHHAVLNKTEFQLDNLIKQVINQFFSNDSITIELEPVTIEADQTRLSLLVKNLLDNAIKYSSQDDPVPSVRLFHDDGHVLLEVEDFGMGMEKEDLAQVTQAFYRVDSARQRNTGGFGLGLYLSQLIVKAHAGEMSFTTEPGQGTCVKVSLPVK